MFGGKTRKWQELVQQDIKIGRLPNAFKRCLWEAEHGTATAQFAIALAYIEGRVISQNSLAARFWFEKAANQGHADAMAYLSWLSLSDTDRQGPSRGLFANKRSPPDIENALQMARRATAAGSVIGMSVVGYILSDPRFARLDIQEADDLLSRGVAGGHPFASFLLARLRLRNQKPSFDHDDVVRLLETAANGGVSKAQYLIGMIYERGWHRLKDDVMALRWYRQSAENGLVPGQRRLGRLLASTQRDSVESQTWLRRAANSGDAEAATDVGVLQCGTRHLPPNFLEAQTWFEKAAAMGHSGSATLLAMLHLTGSGCIEDAVEANWWLTRAKNLGLQVETDEIDYLLGTYDVVTDLPIDIRECFAEPASQGDPLASFRLAICLFLGAGCKRDSAEGVNWLRVAAAKLSSAQLALGQCLLFGRGCGQDMVEAQGWLRQASAAGSVDAQVALAGIAAGRCGR